MKSLLELALAEGENLPKAQARDLGESLVRAIAMAVLEAPEYELSHSKKNLSSCVRVREAAKDYIAQNLRNPNLNRQLVAQYCGVSERYLNATFANEPVNVSSLIRETRLQHCRESLLNPALNHISIMQIAENWGFPDPSSFNRTYRIRFGKSPGEERKATGLGNVRAVRRARD
jgi:AraC-like DNA-binding protein